jgi:hypothetical protein
MSEFLPIDKRRSLMAGNAGSAEPVAVDQPVAGPARGIRSNRFATPGSVEGGDDRRHRLRLRTDADHLDAHRQQIGNLRQQTVSLRRHRLDAVDGQEWLPFAGAQGHPLRVVETPELAVVLAEIVMAGGEATGREGEWQLAENEDLALDTGWTRAVQRLDQPPVGLERRQPAPHATPGECRQRDLVVDVEMGSGDERPAGGDADRTEVVGLEQAAGNRAQFIGQAAQHLQVALRFEQRLRGNDDLLAGRGEIARQRQPVGGANLLPARADDFAEADDVDRRVLRHFGVELVDLVLRPEVEQRSERELHLSSP